jgi:transcriptional regulator with XRE-family HTH domain
MSAIGNNIRKYREAMKMEQQDLGKLLGKTGAAISSWERGQSSPEVSTVEKLCEIFHVDPNALFGWNERGLSRDENVILEFYRQLNAEGQAAATGSLRGLVDSGSFGKRDEVGAEKAIS